MKRLFAAFVAWITSAPAKHPTNGMMVDASRYAIDDEPYPRHEA
ncbi:hypothetical protein [Burkholderia anthina]|nr:hypothetical protein [Burkholderia anthina]